MRPKGLLMALAALSLTSGACSGAAAKAPVVPTITTSGEVVAGTTIGTLQSAASGWAPPASIAPVSPLPGMFQSVGTSPNPAVGKVRVFFLGMQW
jgi:hypothetical protein